LYCSFPVVCDVYSQYKVEVILLSL